jgi:hypothetical protein
MLLYKLLHCVGIGYVLHAAVIPQCTFVDLTIPVFLPPISIIISITSIKYLSCATLEVQIFELYT